MRIASILSKVVSNKNFNSGENFNLTFFVTIFLISTLLLFNASTTSLDLFHPSGETKTWAIFKSADILTSPTVMETPESVSS